MADKTPPPFVASADLTRWAVHAVTPALAARLSSIGFVEAADGGEFELRRSEPMTFEQAGALAASIRDMGIAFNAGHDWSPSEVMQDLRERGLCSGPFTEIAWRGPGEWELRTC